MATTKLTVNKTNKQYNTNPTAINKNNSIDKNNNSDKDYAICSWTK